MIRNPDDTDLKDFQLFGPTVWIIRDGKKSSPIQANLPMKKKRATGIQPFILLVFIVFLIIN